MKSYSNLFDKICAFENLYLASKKAEKGKRFHHEVAVFNARRAENLLEIQKLLRAGQYPFGHFRTIKIVQPKPRLISAAPYPDRVVHHALINVIGPLFERKFIRDSFANQTGKGTHAALDRCTYYARRYHYVWQLDIRKYFPSIDHQILLTEISRTIRCPQTLALIEQIISTSNPQEPANFYFPDDDLFTPFERRKGLPIGNLTSQWFANWYLTGLDHYLTSHLGLRGYVRYCDDFVLLHDDRVALSESLWAVRDWLSHIRLHLKWERSPVTPVKAGLTFVGYRLWATHRLLRKQNIRQFRRRVRWMRGAYARGTVDWSAIRARLDSWMGHARQADSDRLLRRISREWQFMRRQ